MISPGSLTVVVADSCTEIPGNTIQFLTGRIKENDSIVSEGLFEPTYTHSTPKHIVFARRFNGVTPTKQVIIQVLNISPSPHSPVKIYKGVVFKNFVHSQLVCVVENQPLDKDTLSLM
jgi:hypothetical protein